MTKTPTDRNREALAGVFIHHCKHLERSAILRMLHHKIIRPDMVRIPSMAGGYRNHWPTRRMVTLIGATMFPFPRQEKDTPGESSLTEQMRIPPSPLVLTAKVYAGRFAHSCWAGLIY